MPVHSFLALAKSTSEMSTSLAEKLPEELEPGDSIFAILKEK